MNFEYVDVNIAGKKKLKELYDIMIFFTPLWR
jgi:hypothetical protein